MSVTTKLPRESWIAAARITAIVTAIAIVISVGITELLMDTLSHGVSTAGYVVATVMPMILGTPILFYLMVNQQRLKHANRQLNQLASTDWLTSVLNRRAFTTRVTAQLKPAKEAPAEPGGALLIIDADHFKAINDRFGHDQGDEALQLIAAAIRTAVRSVDAVGRLGGEEFGVYLEGADEKVAGVVAERIRRSIAALEFTPNGVPHQLTVSVGGVMCGGAAGFSELFRIADERLYRVKQAGRNRVEFGRIGELPAPTKTESRPAA